MGKLTMVTKGGGITRAKHMRTRMNLVAKVVKNLRVVIPYVYTLQMLADGLSKMINGKDF
jgi:hypothetical protein